MALTPENKFVEKVVPWQETFYPFDGSIPVKKTDYKTHHILSATRPYQFLIGDRSLVMPVTTRLMSGQRDGLELDLFTRKGYQINAKDFNQEERQAALSRKRKHQNGAMIYSVNVTIEWYLHNVDWTGFGKINISDKPQSIIEEVEATGEVAAYFQALRCLVSGNRPFQSRGVMAAFDPQLEGHETEYELDLLEPYTFDSFFPTETPALATENGERGTFWNYPWDDARFSMGEGHSVFLSRQKSQLGVSFTIDDTHYRRQLKASQIL